MAHPELYQHLLENVKPERDQNRDMDIAARWWLFGRTRDEIRRALEGLPRYVATVETAKHRVFQFLDAAVVPDNMLVVIASDDAYVLGVLSSRVHVAWAAHCGGTLEDRPRYTKSHCFDPFPFPTANNIQKQTIRLLAEELDRHRKSVLAAQPHLTQTSFYNVLEKWRGDVLLTAADRRVFECGEIAILRELHEKLDAAVADAYGWFDGLEDTDIVSRLAALNKERVREEVKGQVRWLRPDYQASRFADRKQTAQLDIGEPQAAIAAPRVKRLFPKDDVEQTKAVRAVLTETRRRMTVEDVAAEFRNGKRHIEKIAGILWALSMLVIADDLEDGTFMIRRIAA